LDELIKIYAYVGGMFILAFALLFFSMALVKIATWQRKRHRQKEKSKPIIRHFDKFV